MSFTPEQLRLLQLADQVEDQLTPAERNRLHSAESVRRRIARIGLDEYRRQRRDVVRRWAERRARRTTTPRNAP